MERFRNFFVVFSVLALLMPFSGVDVKAGVLPGPGSIDDCVNNCEDICHDEIVECRENCRTTYTGSDVGQCVKFACALVEECCMNGCLWNLCGIGSEEDGHWCPLY